MDAQTCYEKRAYFGGKRFVPLIFHLFSIEGGARHPWQLSAIATAIAPWLGALSRSHGTRAHHKGGANSGEVLETAQGERKGCTRTWKTNAPRAPRVRFPPWVQKLSKVAHKYCCSDCIGYGRGVQGSLHACKP